MRHRPPPAFRMASKLAAAVIEGRDAEARDIAKEIKRREAEEAARRQAQRRPA